MFESGDKTITIEKFEPNTPGKHPCVVVVHGADGLTALGGAYYRTIARRLARHGYVALFPHYFDRTGATSGDRSKYVTDFVPWMNTLKDAMAYGAGLSSVDGGRMGLLGLSLGSYLSLAVGANNQTGARAVVDYFGGLTDAMGRLLKTMPPTLILHGAKDALVPVAEAYKLQKLFEEKHVQYKMKIYPDQGHGFRGADERDAMERVFAFFDKHLG